MKRKWLTRLELERSIPGLKHTSFQYITLNAGVFPVSDEICNGRRRHLYDPSAVEVIKAWMKKRKAERVKRYPLNTVGESAA
jgi:hypothetical protein